MRCKSLIETKTFHPSKDTQQLFAPCMSNRKPTPVSMPLIPFVGCVVCCCLRLLHHRRRRRHCRLTELFSLLCCVLLFVCFFVLFSFLWWLCVSVETSAWGASCVCASMRMLADVGFGFDLNASCGMLPPHITSICSKLCVRYHQLASGVMWMVQHAT